MFAIFVSLPEFLLCLSEVGDFLRGGEKDRKSLSTGNTANMLTQCVTTVNNELHVTNTVIEKQLENNTANIGVSVFKCHIPTSQEMKKERIEKIKMT